VNAVVEAPRGSRLKIDFDPKFRCFKIARPLPLGMSYPFDWGFIPNTRGADGDPVDALILSDVSTYPGVVVQGRVVGMLELLQTDAGEKPQINNRVLLLPSWRAGHLEEASDLPNAVRAQIEHFFVSIDKFTDIKVAVRGWASAKKAMRFVKTHQR
jgi:inorganic pyrophosphatase